MLKKLLIICCHFNYHFKTKLLEVKIGFGPSDKIEKVECQICKKIYVRGNNSDSSKLVLIVILLIILVMIFF